MRVYITQQGDMIDGIAWRIYGEEFGATEMLLTANPDIALMPPRLPANVRVNLPDLPAPRARQLATVNLWE